MSPKQPRASRIPTWALFAVVAGVLTASAVLFIASYRNSHHAAKTSHAARDNGVPASSDDTLVLPKNDGTTTVTDPSNDRTDLGKNRIDAGVSTDTTPTTSTTPTTPTTPTTSSNGSSAGSGEPTLASLNGAHIALAPADADVISSGKPTVLQRIGNQRVRCGTATTTPALLTRERAVLDALDQTLTAAGAHVLRLDDVHGNVPCAAQRSASFEKNELSIVLATGAPTSSASIAVAGGALAKADIARAQLFVQSLSTATGAPTQLKPAGAAITNLTAHGVVDAPKGGTVVWLALDKAANALDPEHLAGSIASAMAATLA